MNRVARSAVVVACLTLTGCTPADVAARLPPPIAETEPAHFLRPRGTVSDRSESAVPVRIGLLPQQDRPGVGFGVIPTQASDRALRIVWVDSGTAACGRVSAIWPYETQTQVVVSAVEQPTLLRTDCPKRRIAHERTVDLRTELAARRVSSFAGTPGPGTF